jgi:hypothetical protein
VAMQASPDGIQRERKAPLGQAEGGGAG